MLRRRENNRIFGLILIFVLMLLWETLSRTKIINPIFFPPFSQIIIALIKMTLKIEVINQTGHTLYRFILGYLLASFIAIPMGLLMGRSKFFYTLFEPLTEILRPIPSASIIPLAIIIFGIYTKMKLAVIIFGSIWPILINTIHGVKSIDPVLIDTGKIFNLNKRQFYAKILLPAAAPSIFAGMRISLAIALILAITVEMIVGSNGLGFYIINWERSFHFKEMYAGIFILSFLGYAINRLFLIINDKVIKWHKGYTKS